MDLDKFIISIIFDDVKTKDSAKKIENVVEDLKDKILSTFAAIGSISFFKNAIQGAVELSSKLDNLSYATNTNKDDIFAWGEAVKRSGGTAEAFYSSLSSVADKVRDLQTKLGSSAESPFIRLGVQIADANGKIKNSTQLLLDIGDKLRPLSKAWQLDIGKQIGLDVNTIRFITQSRDKIIPLIDTIKNLSDIKKNDAEQNIEFRNTLYDLSLVWDGIKNRIANALIPILKFLTNTLDNLFKSITDNGPGAEAFFISFAAIVSGAAVAAILKFSTVISRFLLPVLARLSVALLVNPFFLVTASIIGLILVVRDLIKWLNGGDAAFKNIYESISKFMDKFQFLKAIKENLKSILIDLNIIDTKKKEVLSGDQKVETVQEKIAKTAIEMKVDPNVAATIANIESGLNPTAKSNRSSAGGLFQLTDKTALENGIKNINEKFDVDKNINAGVSNLKKISDGLSKFFNRAPSGPELYLGERFGLEGSKKLFNANPNSMLASIFDNKVLKANPDIKGLTASQVIRNANNTYSQKSVTVGEININAPNADAQQIAKGARGEIIKEFSKMVTNIDNGARL